MHIPSSPTNRLRILSFEEAFQQSGKGDSYDCSRWLYVPDFYTEYRYILGTRGNKPLICIGINPSTAEPDNLDNTLKSVDRIARFNGFDSFIMFNVYAQRATQPDFMDKELNPELHKANMDAFDYVLSLSETPVIWAAWGTIIEKRPYLQGCVRDMIVLGEKHLAQWVCAGPRSSKGHPHHPLYLKKDSQIEPFDITQYCTKIFT